VQFENACPKSGVSPPHTNRKSKTTFFDDSATYNGNFDGLGLCLRNEIWHT